MSSKEWNSLDPASRKVIADAQRDFPVKVGEIAKAFGLTVLAATLPAGVSGEIRPFGVSYRIKVNRHDSVPRQRFTVAHELAHFLLHRDLIGSGITDDVLYRSALSDYKEAQANRLAADILMPIEAVSREATKRKGLPDGQVVSELSKVFGVSATAMEIRLGLR